jgi:imidazolonepropionase-like amidohydrolase
MKTILLTLFALTGADVHLPDGQVLSDATVLIRNDRIVAVGQDIPVPADAKSIDLSGKTITAGLIDPATTLGLVEIGAVAQSNDTNAGGDPIRAGQRAADSYNPFSAVIPVQRAHGITTVLTSYQGGLISGQAAVYDLIDSALAATPAAMVANIGGQEEGARGSRISALREVLDDARTYTKRKTDIDRNRFRPLAASRLDLEAMQPVLAGTLALHVRVHRRSDIRAVVALAQEFSIRVVIVGGAEAWLEAEMLKAANIPVILNPVANQPYQFDSLHSRDDAAAILSQAGVRVALSTFSAHDVRKLRQWAGNAVRSGMSHADALKSVTHIPADILGLKDRGRIQAGAIANLVVWSGDPFELSSRAEVVLIQGRPVSLGHRQQRLFKRYRTLPVQR